MAKILTFRSKDGSGTDQSFLTDGSETLAFQTGEDGGVRLGDVGETTLPPQFFPDPRKDWSNQELADLFRVRQLLSGANVDVETDRGVTDEGDPWFVFCRPSGDVFIHFSRIGGMYWLDSPNVTRPLTGRDVGALISDFFDNNLPKIPAATVAEGDAPRVVRLERGGKVRLHPSAMLAALIWTLYLASEELVMLSETAAAPAPSTDDDLLDFDTVLTPDAALTSLETSATALIETLVQDGPLGKDTGNDSDLVQTATSSLDGPAHMRDGTGQSQGLHQNAYALSLSTIAIAMGFMSETVLLENQRKVMEGLKDLGLADGLPKDAEATAALDVSIEEDAGLLAMLAEFLGVDLSLNTEIAQATTPKAANPSLNDELKHLTSDAVSESVLPETDDKVAVATGNTDLKDLPTETPVADAPVLLLPIEEQAEEGRMTSEGSAPQDATAAATTEMVQAWEVELEEFQMGQTTVRASFDVNGDNFGLSDVLADMEPTRTTTFRPFDEEAQRLIDFIGAKDGDLGIIELENEIIMVDRGAVRGGATDYMHWETEDGKIISLVGLITDFEQFQMIA